MHNLSEQFLSSKPSLRLSTQRRRTVFASESLVTEEEEVIGSELIAAIIELSEIELLDGAATQLKKLCEQVEEVEAVVLANSIIGFANVFVRSDTNDNKQDGRAVLEVMGQRVAADRLIVVGKRRNKND